MIKTLHHQEIQAISSSKAFPVERFLLPNGLTLFVEEDHRAPIASLQAWCKTGSIHEGECLGGGISHLLEHMLFKGTSSRTGAEISHQVQAQGGYINAATSYDYTFYTIDMPRAGVGIGLEILADITQHTFFSEEEFEREKEVIRRELAMYADRPDRILFEEMLMPTLFPNSPYGLPIGGDLAVFNTITREQVIDYYQKRYIPNNMAFVVVGDVIASEIYEQLNELFSQTPRRALSPVVVTTEPPQRSPRSFRREYPTELSRFSLAWRMPGLSAEEAPACDILAHLLGGGRSSLLYQEIREKQKLVQSISASYETFGAQEGVLLISAIAHQQERDTALEAIKTRLQRFLEEGVTTSEIEKAQKGMLMEHYSSLRTMKGRCADYGDSWVVTGDPQFGDVYLEAINQVSPEEVHHLATHYLQPAFLSIVALDPPSTENFPETLSKGPKESLLEKDHSSTFSKAVSLSNSKARVKSDSERHHVEKVMLPNQLRLLICHDSSLPQVHLHAMFRGGLLTESSELNGISHLLAGTLFRGTKKQTATQIIERIEGVGGSIGASAHPNSFSLSEHLLSEDLSLGLDLLAEILTEATFTPEQIAKERVTQLAAIQAEKDHPLSLLSKAFKKQLFQDHPYGRPLLGEATTVASITREHLLDYYHQYCVAANGVIAVAGNVEPNHLIELVSNAFEKMPTGALALSHPPAPVVPPQLERVMVSGDKEQAVLIKGFLGADFLSPDRLALEMIEEACSDLGSRFFHRIREEQGLAYYVGGRNSMGLVPGCFSFYLGCDPKKAPFALSELSDEIGKLAAEGLSEEEFERCRQKLLGEEAFASETATGVVLGAVGDELLGLGYDHYLQRRQEIEALSRDDVKKVAQKYFDIPGAVEAIFSPALTTFK